MTGANINSFVGDLVTMAKAFEDLPKVQEELSSAKEQIVKDGATIARLEMKLQDRANEIAGLTSRIRSLEVERDDASFRQLEAEDKFDALRRAIGTVQTTLGSAVKATEPEPAPTPEELKVQAQPMSPPFGEGFSSLQAQAQPVPQDTGSTHSTEGDTYSGAAIAGNGNGDPGQSEANPTYTSLPSGAPAMDTHTVQETSIASGAEPKPQPFAGKRYYDHPSYVTLSDWLSGGGTEEDYHWRPQTRSAF